MQSMLVTALHGYYVSDHLMVDSDQGTRLAFLYEEMCANNNNFPLRKYLMNEVEDSNR